MKTNAPRAPITAQLLRVLLFTWATGSLPLAAAEELTNVEPAADSSPEANVLVATSPDVEAYREAIALLESGEGAYSSALPEQLLSLGVSLQQSGNHSEAVDIFKRGVHLSRINNGLYGPEQVMLLQREIASHIALGQYEAADERQHYLYKVQVRSMTTGSDRADAFMAQAQWQYNAYRLNLGGPGYSRVMRMWDLYRLALNDIIEREGETSLALLPPLEGMLLAQYLIAGYQTESGAGGFNSTESVSFQQEANRFYAYRSQSYKRGRAVIQAMYDIQQVNHGENSRETAQTMTMMGDWTMWFGESEAATAAYQQAAAELVALGTAQEEVDQLFSEPVALPNYDGARPLPEHIAPREDVLVLEFTVSARGKVEDLERLDENEFEGSYAKRLMRKLRKTRYRPQLAMGELVTKEKVVRAYETQ